MFKLKSLRLVPALLGLAMLVIIGCNSDGSSDSSTITNVVDKLIDTASAKIADKVVGAAFTEATFAQATDSGSQASAKSENEFQSTEFSDFLITDDKLYALFDGGLVVHDLTSGNNVVVSTDEALEAIVLHQGEIYVGGKYLYRLNLYSLVKQEGEYIGGIRALYSYDHLLMIGTESALYSSSVFGREKLAEDITVTALAGDRDGLWVGTDGDGLYRWDGTDFKRRYLIRDSSLFDNVNTLDFKHDHLYVGSTKGLHIYDGGRWQNLSTEDGLPTDNVTSIDASAWVIYIGTDKGVVSFFNNEFSPVNRLEDVRVNKIIRNRRKSFVATSSSGVLVNSRSLLKTLIEPVSDEPSTMLTLTQ